MVVVGGGGAAAVVVVSTAGAIGSVGSGSDGCEVAAVLGLSVVVEAVSSPNMPASTNRVRSPPRVMAHHRWYQGMLSSSADSAGWGTGSGFGMVTIVLGTDDGIIAKLWRLVGAVRRLAFDRTLPPSAALGRIRDAFGVYDGRVDDEGTASPSCAPSCKQRVQ